MKTVDETAITEISIKPDGRIYVFGMSQEVLGVLSALCPDDPLVQDRVSRLKALDVLEPPARVTSRSNS